MVKIAICDDETEFLDLLSESLASRCRAHQLTLQLYRFTNGDELISAHRAYGMDLILLDMIMPLLSGMDTARELRQHDPHVPIIFLTSSPEFALESYEVRTFWYLLKPLDEVRFHAVLRQLVRSPQGFHGSFRGKNRFRLPVDLFSGCRISGSAK